MLAESANSSPLKLKINKQKGFLPLSLVPSKFLYAACLVY
jgi:hypothetical protein